MRARAVVEAMSMAKDESATTGATGSRSTPDPPPDPTPPPEVPAVEADRAETAPSEPPEPAPAPPPTEPSPQAPAARVSLTTVVLAVQHRQRGTGIPEVQRAMIAQGARGITDDGMPGDAFDDAVAKLRGKWKMGEGGVDAPFLSRLGLDVGE